MNPLKKYFILFSTLTIIYFLNRNWNSLPALGPFLDPYHGCWQNTSTETASKVIFKMKALKQPVEVRFDERLVPHIFATNNLDAIFVQGYLHATFRLWQMDMTTRLASGRLSEVVGKKTLQMDREMRRKGMVYAAENSLKVMEMDTESKSILDAYTHGVNCYIQTLRYKTFPLEYKLMGFEPEEWTNLKTSLMIKFMADKLSGHTEDFELTVAKKIFGNQFDLLYPEHLDEEYPVIGEINDKIISCPTDTTKQKSLSSKSKLSVIELDNDKNTNNEKQSSEDGIGSNNWALSGSKTASGKPILCNDPHLPLNLPAIWYENQIITPTMNVYGVSLPGAPEIVIGFNDSIAWGFTNGYRDVKDFYTIQFKNDSKKEYLMDGRFLQSTLKIEHIKIKGSLDFIDTVAYTKMGIVMYDKSFPKEGFEQQNFAVRWMAHTGSNELRALFRLNQSKNYSMYVNAIQDFHCPHQNIAFAAANGDIAMWSQGLFIHKKQEQGRFIEDGTTLQNQWKNNINESDNPHVLNPECGYVVSANQVNTSVEYPFYYNGIFTEERAKRITHLLSDHKKYMVKDMMKMQNDTYWQNAADILPILISYLDSSTLSVSQHQLLNELKQWDYYTLPHSTTPVLYSLWFSQFEKDTYDDEIGNYLNVTNYPKERATLQLLRKHPELEIFDDTQTTKIEKVSDIALKSFLEMTVNYSKIKGIEWYKFKHTTAEHLSKISAFSVPDILIGGGHGIVNAATDHTGPSWRMIVQFSNPIEAYGIYPGGQSGNIASQFYTNMLDDWANGKYYRLIFAHTPNDIP